MFFCERLPHTDGAVTAWGSGDWSSVERHKTYTQERRRKQLDGSAETMCDYEYEQGELLITSVGSTTLNLRALQLQRSACPHLALAPCWPLQDHVHRVPCPPPRRSPLLVLLCVIACTRAGHLPPNTLHHLDVRSPPPHTVPTLRVLLTRLPSAPGRHSSQSCPPQRWALRGCDWPRR